MPWLYLERWDGWIENVPQANFALGETVIKVFAVSRNPQEIFSNPAIFTVEMDGSPLGSDTKYKFEGRETFTGHQLDDFISQFGVTEPTNNDMRALFRFSHMHGFLGRAMQMVRDNEYVINHPIEVIDGIRYIKNRPRLLHLDIFLRASLDTLKNIVNYDEERLLVGRREGLKWRMGQLS